MKILIIGTGALGCFYGAKLAKQGANISFLSRGKTYDRIARDGIVIDSDTEESFQTQVHLIKNPDDIPDYDLVIIAVKSYDVPDLLEDIPFHLIKKSYFMTLQNGLMTEDSLVKQIQKAHLLPVSAFVGLKKTDLNRVHHSGGGRFQFGPYSGGEADAFSKGIINLFSDSKIDIHYSNEILKIKWGKLLWNSAYNPLSTITELTLGPIVTSKYGIDLLRNAMNECRAIAAAYNIELSDSFIEKQIDLPERLYSFKTSMLQDYQNGKKLEIEAILGDLINKGKEKNIQPITLMTFYNLLHLFINNKDKKN